MKLQKQVDEILKNSKISVKWKNFNKWQTEDYSNLKDAIPFNSIKFVQPIGSSELIFLRMQVGNITMKCVSEFCYLERDVIELIKHRALYLGDETKIISRFGTVKIN